VSVHPEIKKALLAAQEAAGDLPFTLTPGRRKTVPRLARTSSGNRLVDMPVVVLRAIDRGPARGLVLKFPDNGIRHIDSRFCTEMKSPGEWAHALWQWPANARAIGGAS
jgi:hypothetical protein